MTTLAHSARPSKASRPAPRILTIRGVPYAIEAIDPGEDGTAAFSLTKQLPDADPYHVIRTHAGLVECDCPDYEARRRNTASMCKHGAALVSARLLAAPKPTPMSPDALRVAQAKAFGIRLPVKPAIEPPTATAIITPAADEGEGRGEPGEDLGPADPIDEWEDADLDAFPAWTDYDDGDDDRMTLPEFLEFTRDAFEAIGSGASNLIVEALNNLLSECRILGNPATAEQFLDRRDAMLFDRYAQWETQSE